MIIQNCVSVIGPSHILSDLPNQDCAYIGRKRGYWVAAVADGIGSRKHSDIGSHCAVKCVQRLLDAPGMTLNQEPRQIIGSLYRHWVDLIKEKRIAPKLAATTLLFVLGDSQGNFIFAQLGDGLICTNSSILTSLEEEQIFGNLTTGLGISKKFQDWQFGSGQLHPSESLYLMTDGISEDLNDSLGFVSFLYQKQKKSSPRCFKKWLKRQLINWPTPHHTDDKSLSMVIFL